MAQHSADDNDIIVGLSAGRNVLYAFATQTKNSYTKSEFDDALYTKTYSSTTLNGNVDVATLS